MKVSSSSRQFFVNKTNNNGEVIPWGVSAVWKGEDISKRGNFASDTYAFVIDSGVSNATGDINLASEINWHYSWINGESAFTDNYGHGTHVAGTIGALVNGKGIIGVAPGAQIVSLKVLNKDGFASESSTVEAINYAVSVINNNNLDKNKVVINLSLGSIYSSLLDTVVRNAADQGIKFSISAGNSGKDVDGQSPASAGDHPNVFTVSAVDRNYQMPSWSNWDSIDSNDNVDDIDFAAPGVDVLSYYQNSQIVSLSGTSMAAPHVAGLLITGGVRSGNYVTPSYSNTSDPFAITSSQPFVPTVKSSRSHRRKNVSKTLASQSLWGTSKNDIIVGGNGKDRISGALSSGTTLESMGVGQIDVLTGRRGADVFVLGDSRGVFYDDQIVGNLGTSDHALIKDFKSKKDKLQLKKENSYLFESSDGNLFLYSDLNQNRRLESVGVNQDELIAILEGVTTLGKNDFIMVS
jgi:subtilisin family serine protease